MGLRLKTFRYILEKSIDSYKQPAVVSLNVSFCDYFSRSSNIYFYRYFTGSMRLVDGSNSYEHVEGRLEIYLSGIWGTICDDHFDCAATMVVCRQLGYRLNTYCYIVQA